MKNRSYFLLALSLVILLSLSLENSEKMRMRAIAIFAPSWTMLQRTKMAFSNFWEWLSESQLGAKKREELQRLMLQNQLLLGENYKLRQLLKADWGGYDAQDDILYAEVIFRAPATWNSSLWINVGTDSNENLSRCIVAKNSPVLHGRSLVGVIDWVGAKQSRVRLITDSGLTPSVRAMRVVGKQAHLLAKGELHGSSAPLWRRAPHLLKGIGFNYDFEDSEGPARDLRSGKSQDVTRSVVSMPLIQVGDQLVTTGLDGVFPTGLDVAVVTKVFSLREGDYYYEIEARPTAGALDNLSYLLVLPPIGYDAEDF